MGIPEVWGQHARGIQRQGQERAQGRARWDAGGIGSSSREVGEVNPHLQIRKCVCKSWYNPFRFPRMRVGLDYIVEGRESQGMGSELNSGGSGNHGRCLRRGVGHGCPWKGSFIGYSGNPD